MVSNKELQESRIRGYFIEAARETLKGEGLKAVNVRTVSERAGYSFATLYNYFRDLNELIFVCVQDFMNECETFCCEQSALAEPGRERLGAKMMAYIGYFTQYPGIFELFYTERMNDLGARQPTARMIYEFTDRIGNEDIIYLLENKDVTPEQAALLRLNLRNSIAGLLLLYNNRQQPTDHREFLDIAGKQMEISLGLINKR
jgi:AcrR family transcriptional regulator